MSAKALGILATVLSVAGILGGWTYSAIDHYAAKRAENQNITDRLGSLERQVEKLWGRTGGKPQ